MLVKIKGRFLGFTTGTGTVEYPQSYRDGATVAGGAFRFKVINGEIKAEDGQSDLKVLGAAIGGAMPPMLRLVVVPTPPSKAFVVELLPIPNAPSQGADIVDISIVGPDVAIVLPVVAVKSLDAAKQEALDAAAAANLSKTQAISAAMAANTAAGYAQGVGDQVAAVGRQLPAPPVLDDAAKNTHFASHPGDGVSVLVWSTGHLWQRVNGVVTDLGAAAGGPGGGQGLKSVATTAALGGMAAPVLGDVVNVRGAAADGDGGGGLWAWVRGARPARDGMLTEYHQTNSTGYFARVWDGVRAQLSWAGLGVAAGAAAVTAALGVLAAAPVFIDLDKTYQAEQPITVPTNARLYGRYGVGFVSVNGNSTLVKCAPGSGLVDVNVDGQAALARNPNFSGRTLVESNSTLDQPVTITGLKAKNAPDHVVFGYGAHGTVIKDLTVDGSCAEAVFFQLSDSVVVDGFKGKNLQHDGVKIHSKDGTPSNLNREIMGPTIKGISLDYSNVTITGDVLAVEIWGGQTAFVNNPRLSNINIISPKAMNGGSFWGVSFDTVRGGTCREFFVTSQGRGTIVFGIEQAGCIDSTFDTGTVDGYGYIGASFSQPQTRNVKMRNVTLQNAVLSPNGDTYAVQWYNGISGGDLDGVTVKDGGYRYLFFNNAGAYASIANSHLLIGHQVVPPHAFYVTGNVRGVRAINNNTGPAIWGSETPSNGYVRPGDIAGALNWTVALNTFDANRPDGSATSAGDNGMPVYGGGGGHIFLSNVCLGWKTTIFGQYDNGPASTFLYNVRDDGGPAQAARSGVDTVVAAGSSSGGGSSSSYVVLPKQSVSNATLRGGFPDKVISTVAMNDDTAHGFPTTKGMLKTDRTGWELTQYGQLQYDRQTWIPYDGGNAVEYRRGASLDGSWGAWQQFPAAGSGAAAQVSYVIAGVTGGVIGSVVLTSGGVAHTIHPGAHQELRSGNAMLMRGPDGRYYAPGSEVPGWANKTQGVKVYLIPPVDNASLNIGEYPAGSEPGSTPMIPTLEIGWWKDATTLIYLPQVPVEVADTAGYSGDDMTPYLTGSAPAQYVSQWAAIGEPPKVVAEAKFKNGKALEVYGGNGNHLIGVTPALSPDGSILHEFVLTSSSAKVMTLGGRITGSVGTGNAVTFEVDNGAGQMRLCKWVGGFRTDLKLAGSGLSEGVVYWMEFQWRGSLLRGRIWKRGDPRPLWQIVTYDSAVITSGLAGYGFTDGAVHSGIIAYTRGTTTLSDVVDLSN